MAIECKVCDKRFEIKGGDGLRPSQWATLMKLKDGIPVIHKIADGGRGSKLVDLLYINPDAVRFIPYVAIKFLNNGHCYLVPFQHIYHVYNNKIKSIIEKDLDGKYKIKF